MPDDENVQDPQPTEPQDAPAEPAGGDQPTESSSQPIQDDLVRTVTEAVTHNLQSFMGRRDKALADTITKNFDSIVEKKMKAYTHAEPKEPAEFDWQNPQQAIRQVFTELKQEETQQERHFKENLLNGVGGYMDNNPLFQDKELGQAVLQTVLENVKAGNLRTDIAPDIAGQMLVQDATMSVIAAQKKNSNALSGRPLPNAPNGSVNAPAGGGPKQEIRMPKLSAEAQKLVDRFGYSAEEVTKILGDEA